MHNKLVFYILLITLIAAGSWGIMRAGFSPLGGKSYKLELERSVSSEPYRPESKENRNIANGSSAQLEINDRFHAVQTLVRTGNAQQAATAINQYYSSLSRDELEQLKQEFLSRAANASGDDKKSILLAASAAFDELDIWKALANAAVKAADWQVAFDSQLRASQLENDSIELDSLLARLVQSSSHLRADFEKSNDQLSIKTLYQGLVDLHPQFNRFQLELAYAQTRIDEFEAAKTILNTLSYDPEFGDIAQQALARINETETEQSAVASTDLPVEPERRNDIVVPLIAAGSSFLIDTSIDRQRSRLLLDTGASITALSSDLIQRLKLKPTGQSIQLSTANGLTRARLYRAERISLGRLTLKNMVVAEIDLGRRASFEGLLGTDALNQFKSRYSYIIDNQKNALIFRAR